MDFFRDIIDFVLHIDKHLGELIRQHGVWTNVILFAIVFAETGLVVTPFLPGDSLLFAAGAMSALYPESLNPFALFGLLAVAAILGDTVNYFVGQYFGERVTKIRFVKQKHLDKTHAFFEKYGGRTIIIARFVPIVRTFAPFVAGMGKMTYRTFALYNIVGGIVWVGIFIAAGYFFGQMDVVKENFELVTLAIIGLSILPIVFEVVREMINKRKEKTAPVE